MNKKTLLKSFGGQHIFGGANRYGNPAPKEGKHRQEAWNHQGNATHRMLVQCQTLVSIYSVLYHVLQSHDIDLITPEILRVWKRSAEGFPGGAVDKNPPANAGDTGSSPGPGRSHMPRSN